MDSFTFSFISFINQRQRADALGQPQREISQWFRLNSGIFKKWAFSIIYMGLFNDQEFIRSC
ncbi:UNKNOWN [Stylonychia lemnae]|uniref:Uncharacterized protein n=1 Tax=Stylonychia lemnae TaxID=5949 RepID=A0A078A717_STYLE|nr:UNKNOWN [Stylonychia lemnae]|eukprot:CDW77676.1 UNKNOWN [Stylonychia lemnae]